MSVRRLEVRVSPVDDLRAAVFSVLAELPDRKRAAVTSRILQVLKSGRWLAGNIDQHYSAADAARLLGRCPEYIAREAKSGRLGVVYRDDGGWIIPASGLQAWLDRRIFSGSVSES